MMELIVVFGFDLTDIIDYLGFGTFPSRIDYNSPGTDGIEKE